MDLNVWLSKKKNWQCALVEEEYIELGNFLHGSGFGTIFQSFTGNMIQSMKYENSGCESVGDQNDCKFM